MAGLLFAISAHGLGHLGQAAPVCQALHDLRPDLPLTIWSALPLATLQQRINRPFHHIRASCDIGFLMQDAFRVDVSASWKCYQAREAMWSKHLAEACDIVRATKPDLVVSDVGDMPLAAAQALGIPDVAMSSLNWADLSAYYFSGITDAKPVLNRLTHIYDNARLAIRLTPGMPMRGRREEIVPPVAALSQQARGPLHQDILSALGPAYQHRPILLIGMGGIMTPLPLSQWPAQNNLALLVANQPQLPSIGSPVQGIANADALQQTMQLTFSDLLYAADAVVCKPGYGTFAEAALAGTPVLYVPRPDWPEQDVLIDWLQSHAQCAELSPDDLLQGSFHGPLTHLLAQPAKLPVPNDGATIAARKILSLLGPLERKS